MTAVAFFSAFSRSAGLAGFFPLHPMTITEAERRRTQAEQTQNTLGTEESLDEGQKQAEV